jgi:bifunctional DNase/RNase
MENETTVYQVKLIGLIMDPISKCPVMVLKPINEKKIIPIWIGGFEANAITMELESITPPRPMTHDLFKSVLFHCGAKLKKVVITDVIENTFFAELHLQKENGDMIQLDSRPSDAVTLALKVGAPIFVTDPVYNGSILSDHFSEFLSTEEQLEDWFNSLSPDDFGQIEQ